MNVANRDSQRIRSVERLRQRVQLEQSADHLLDLRLFRAAVACHSAFHFQRRIFENRQVRFSGREDRDAADVPQFQRALNIGCIEQTFESRRFGLEIA